MMQVVLHHFPAAQVEYRFQCRTPNIDLSPYLPEIENEIDALCQLHFTEHELDYLGGLRFIKSDFVDFLGLFHLPRKCVSLNPSEVQGGIDVTVKGPWLHTILFEIPILAIINEVYFRHVSPDPDLEEGRRRLNEKIAMVCSEPDLATFRVAEYGTRRRFSRRWHEEVITTLQRSMGEHFAGTSNVDLAMRFGSTPIGTMGHEYLQACQALGPRLRDSQVFALETWAREYRGDLGIALTDTVGMDAFLADLCTPAELRAFAERWQVARLLDAGGKSYREIAAEAHASPTTVVRVARYLKDMPHQGYRLALDRLKTKN
jgi:nicotinate phosphoribosyltransferase